MNRGSPVLSPRSDARVHRFNEAPIHESGKSSRPSSHRDSCCGFNEAPIHESGKCAAAIRRGATDGRFNEAPIHESGKFGSLAAARRWAERLQ